MSTVCSYFRSCREVKWMIPEYPRWENQWYYLNIWLWKTLPGSVNWVARATGRVPCGLPRHRYGTDRRAWLAKVVFLSSQSLNAHDLHAPAPVCSWDCCLVTPVCALKSYPSLREESRRGLTLWASFTGLLWGVNEWIPVTHSQKHWHIASIPQRSTFQTIYKKMKGSLLRWGRLWWLWAFIAYYRVWINGEAIWGSQESFLTSQGLSFLRSQRWFVCKYLYWAGLLTELNQKDAFNQAQWLSLLIFSVSKAGKRSVDQSVSALVNCDTGC